MMSFHVRSPPLTVSHLLVPSHIYSLITCEADDEFVIPIDYATRVCRMYAELGARGVTVLQATGDFGVGGTRPNSCHETGNIFAPSFPATCP